MRARVSITLDVGTIETASLSCTVKSSVCVKEVVKVYMSLLPPCKYRFGVFSAKERKIKIKCAHRNEVVDIEECFKCRIPFETDERLSGCLDELAQLFEHVYKFSEDLDKPIKQLLDAIKDFSETISSIRGTPVNYEIANTLGYVIGIFVVEAGMRFGRHTALEGYKNSAKFLNLATHPHFTDVAHVIKGLLEDRYGLTLER